MTVVPSDNTQGELTTLDLDELEDELATLASHIYAGTCRWLELVAEFDRRPGWAESGCGSCAEWLAWRCALLPRAAREHVRVARRLGELPLIHGAFSRGELSYAKARALTRVADERSEAALTDLARCLTAAQLERALRAYRRVTTEEAKEVQAHEHLVAFWDEDGSLVVRGQLAPEDGALFLRALEAAKDSLWDAGDGSAEPPPVPGRPTNAEALVAMADAALAGEATSRSGGERYQVVVHVDAGGGSDLAEGPAIAQETARRLACDASLVQIVEREGEALSVGRKTRTIPPALRRALKARDRGCRFPGCENRLFVDAHHVRRWAKGGETKLANLVLLCRRHHRAVHEGGYAVEILADARVRFRKPCGVPIAEAPRPPPGMSEQLLERNDRSGFAIDRKTCSSGDGEPMDLALAVDGLIQIAGVREG